MPFPECLAALREQVGKRKRFRILGGNTSRVVGHVGDATFTLEAASDLFPKRLVGRLVPVGGGTELDGRWSIPFWSHIWGDHRYDEEEVFRFLEEHCQLQKRNED